MNKIFLFILFIMVLAGCERYDDVDIDIPYKPKIVTYCFLQTSSTEVQVAVARSQPVFNTTPKPGAEPEPEYITDATVMLQQNFNIYFLEYDTASKLYQVSLPSAIKANEHYKLTVTSGSETSTGSTTLPGKVNANVQVKFDSTLQSEGLYQYSATITCTPTDPGKHYIELYPILFYDDSITEPDLMGSTTISKVTELNQGQSVTKTFYSTVSINGVSPARLELMIVNCDEAYAKNTYSIFSSPLFSPFQDPAITYTNMSGGIGLFGSYNPETRYTFNLK